MNEFEMPIQIRWSDMDPNFHIRHTIYFEWGAMCRVEFFEKLGLTVRKMQEKRIGPILFREEAIYKKEIRIEDKVSISLLVTKARKDFSRASILHKIKKEGEIISALINVDLAWIDGVTRKLAKLPDEWKELLQEFPLSEDFQWID